MWDIQYGLTLSTPLLVVCVLVSSLPPLLLHIHRSQLKVPIGKVPAGVRLWLGFNKCTAQVLATSLNAYFQLTIMLIILVVGLATLAHLRPYRAPQCCQDAWDAGCDEYWVSASTSSIISVVRLPAVQAGRLLEHLLVCYKVAWVLAVVRVIAKIGLPDARTHVVR